MQANPKMLKRFIYYVNEREAIQRKREAGHPWPWTEDVVLRDHHFCCNRREDDRGTKEIRAVCRELGVADRELPEFYTAARLLNYAPSLLIYWRDGLEALKDYRAAGNKIFHVAYVVTTCGQRMDKLNYVDEVVGDVRSTFIPVTSCYDAYSALRNIDGLGSFLAGQVVADLKNDLYLERAPDWHTFAVMGPGSKKFLDMLFGPGTTELTFYPRLLELKRLTDGKIPELHMQDLQNCCCETSKYIRYADNLRGRRRMYNAYK